MTSAFRVVAPGRWVRGTRERHPTGCLSRRRAFLGFAISTISGRFMSSARLSMLVLAAGARGLVLPSPLPPTAALQVSQQAPASVLQAGQLLPHSLAPASSSDLLFPSDRGASFRTTNVLAAKKVSGKYSSLFQDDGDDDIANILKTAREAAEADSPAVEPPPPPPPPSPPPPPPPPMVAAPAPEATVATPEPAEAPSLAMPDLSSLKAPDLPSFASPDLSTLKMPAGMPAGMPSFKAPDLSSFKAPAMPAGMPSFKAPDLSSLKAPSISMPDVSSMPAFAPSTEVPPPPPPPVLSAPSTPVAPLPAASEAPPAEEVIAEQKQEIAELRQELEKAQTTAPDESVTPPAPPVEQTTDGLFGMYDNAPPAAPSRSSSIDSIFSPLKQMSPGTLAIPPMPTSPSALLESATPQLENGKAAAERALKDAVPALEAAGKAAAKSTQQAATAAAPVVKKAVEDYAPAVGGVARDVAGGLGKIAGVAGNVLGPTFELGAKAGGKALIDAGGVAAKTAGSALGSAANTAGSALSTQAGAALKSKGVEMPTISVDPAVAPALNSGLAKELARATEEGKKLANQATPILQKEVKSTADKVAPQLARALKGGIAAVRDATNPSEEAKLRKEIAQLQGQVQKPKALTISSDDAKLRDEIAQLRQELEKQGSMAE